MGLMKLMKIGPLFIVWVLIYTSITENLTIALGISKLTEIENSKNKVNTRVSE